MSDVIHHEFSPSKLERLCVCPGSYQMTRWLPSVGGPAADEGTLLHNAVATKNREGLNSEQEELFFSCFETMKQMEINDATGAKIWKAELPVQVKDQTGEVLTNGTTDLLVQNDAGLTIIDWKFGRNPVPEASKNLQLAAYAAGAMQLTGETSCRAAIFQPRLNEFSEYVFTNESAIVRNIKRIIDRAKREDVLELHISASCWYCPAAKFCPKLRSEAANVESRSVAFIDPDDLAALFDKALIIRKAIDAIEDAVKEKCDENGSCGGYHWKMRQGPLECVDIAELFDRLKNTLSPEEIIASVNVVRSKIMDAYIDKEIARAKETGGKLLKKEAKKNFEELTEDIFVRKDPTKVLVYGGKE